MTDINIYLAGGMSGLSFEDQIKWRNRLKDAILYGEHECSKHPVFFSPPEYFSLFDQEHKSEKEVMEYDLYHLKRSDLVVVNFNVPNSIGTAMELAIAKENKIPVVGLHQSGETLHPWLIECTARICDTFKELVEYVINFYLL